jgi:hypothetical protein
MNNYVILFVDFNFIYWGNIFYVMKILKTFHINTSIYIYINPTWATYYAYAPNHAVNAKVIMKNMTEIIMNINTAPYAKSAII